MPELIDRNELRRRIYDRFGQYSTKVIATVEEGKIIEDWAFLEPFLNAAPTIDAEPVKHAKWESWGYVFHGIEWKRCSACGKCAGVSYYGLLDGKIKMETPARCGCCGAKMQTEPPEEVQE